MSTYFKSEEFREWAKSYDSDDPLVLLITLTHSSLSEPIRVSSDATKFLQFDDETQEPIYGTVSRENTYYAFPFSFTLPDQPESADQTVKATLRIDNVTQQYTQFIRDITVTPTLTLEFVFASTPDAVIETLPNFIINNITYDAKTIECELGVDDFRLDVFPGIQFYPSIFPGLFS